MEISVKKREKWVSLLPKFSLGLAIVSLLALFLVAIPLVRSSGFVNQDVRSPRRRLSPHVQGLCRYPIRRRLSAGPGSYPPRCTYKCGRCTPCNPVHVPVPPGTLFFPTEYYPEAWRCKCGNRLYMP
ncbi:EPIDERMAL PATTERNING FACTOR-like protein [Rhynchospora pubera]|uniref:Epidermal patterning factor-like protein n=1 Tax=Rhynchospora pubera TaxID=906938 RepID=A0AAV8EPG9_9POAL|nr:EPIDERMAL PATTERNING FACTOR-like protein [Rhynchospora pubera]